MCKTGNSRIICICAIFIIAFSIGCTDFFASLEKHHDWIVTEEGNIVLHSRPKGFSNSASPDENIINSILANQNFYYYLILDSLKLNYNDKVLIYLYNHDEAQDAIGTNSGGSIMASRSTIYYSFMIGSYKDLFWRDAYIGSEKMVKLITQRSLGSNYTRLMYDGYAVAFSGSFGKAYDENQEIIIANPVSDWMNIHHINNHILSPEQLLYETGWDNDIYIPNAGFFIRFLWKMYGVAEVNKLFNLNSDNIVSKIPEIFGVSFEELSDDYEKYLESVLDNNNEN